MIRNIKLLLLSRPPDNICCFLLYLFNNDTFGIHVINVEGIVLVSIVAE